jgi:glutathione peroxidase
VFFVSPWEIKRVSRKATKHTKKNTLCSLCLRGKHNQLHKLKKIKKILLTIAIIFIAFTAYVIIVNRNSKNMTLRQKLLKAVYPAFMWITGKKANSYSNNQAQPSIPFYSLKAVLNNGKEFDFTQLKGKKVLLVNTASNCGYTNQYDDLQKLNEQQKDKLVILGFPANDFKEQEKGNDEEIAEFCKINFGVTFPLMKKSVVVKGTEQNEVFKWLSNSALNGWSNKQPSWNFSKYLVNEEGILTNYFDPSISPTSAEVIKAIEEK